MEWLNRRIESIVDNLIFSGFIAGGVIVWTALKSLPIPVIVGIAIITFLLIFVIIRIIRAFLNRNKKVTKILNSSAIRYFPDFRDLLKEQQGHEEQWLRSVIEWIDFNSEWLPKSKVILKYQIDSGLIYDFKPYRMWIKLRIGQYEPEEGWEILQTPNLLKCRRSQFASQTFIVHDEDLAKIIEGYRQGLKIALTLKIVIQLRIGEDLRGLEPTYSINPYSETVSGLLK